jgi:uncharacterized membrane protein YuzA (DUF378 family)
MLKDILISIKAYFTIMLLNLIGLFGFDFEEIKKIFGDAELFLKPVVMIVGIVLSIAQILYIIKKLKEKKRYGK